MNVIWVSILIFFLSFPAIGHAQDCGLLFDRSDAPSAMNGFFGEVADLDQKRARGLGKKTPLPTGEEQFQSELTSLLEVLRSPAWVQTFPQTVEASGRRLVRLLESARFHDSVRARLSGESFVFSHPNVFPLILIGMIEGRIPIKVFEKKHSLERLFGVWGVGEKAPRDLTPLLSAQLQNERYQRAYEEILIKSVRVGSSEEVYRTFQLFSLLGLSPKKFNTFYEAIYKRGKRSDEVEELYWEDHGEFFPLLSMYVQFGLRRSYWKHLAHRPVSKRAVTNQSASETIRQFLKRENPPVIRNILVSALGFSPYVPFYFTPNIEVLAKVWHATERGSVGRAVVERAIETVLPEQSPDLMKFDGILHARRFKMATLLGIQPDDPPDHIE